MKKNLHLPLIIVLFAFESNITYASSEIDRSKYNNLKKQITDNNKCIEGSFQELSSREKIFCAKISLSGTILSPVSVVPGQETFNEDGTWEAIYYATAPSFHSGYWNISKTPDGLPELCTSETTRNNVKLENSILECRHIYSISMNENIELSDITITDIRYTAKISKIGQ